MNFLRNHSSCKYIIINGGRADKMRASDRPTINETGALSHGLRCFHLALPSKKSWYKMYVGILRLILLLLRLLFRFFTTTFCTGLSPLLAREEPRDERQCKHTNGGRRANRGSKSSLHTLAILQMTHDSYTANKTHCYCKQTHSYCK